GRLLVPGLARARARMGRKRAAPGGLRERGRARGAYRTGPALLAGGRGTYGRRLPKPGIAPPRVRQSQATLGIPESLPGDRGVRQKRTLGANVRHALSNQRQFSS